MDEMSFSSRRCSSRNRHRTSLERRSGSRAELGVGVLRVRHPGLRVVLLLAELRARRPGRSPLHLQGETHLFRKKELSCKKSVLALQEERDYILAETPSLARDEGEDRPPPPWRSIATSPPFLALVAAHVGQNWGLYTLLMMAPSYLAGIQHLSLEQVLSLMKTHVD